jgi:hypothetical protein
MVEVAYSLISSSTEGVNLVESTKPLLQQAIEQPSKVKNLRTSKTSWKIEVAVIGAGSFARSMHLPNLRSLSDLYRIRAIVERDGVQARLTADQFGANNASIQVDDVLANPAIKWL